MPTLAEIAGPAREHLDAGAIAPLVLAGCRPEFDACLVTAELPAERACPWRPDEPLSAADQRRARADHRCQDFADRYYYDSYLRVAVDDGAALPILTGADPDDLAAATAMLRAGGAVVTDPRYLEDGQLDIRIQRNPGDAVRTTDSATVPGYALSTGVAEKWLLLSPAAADRLDLATRQIGWAIDAGEPPGRDSQNRFIAALRPLGSVGVEIENSRGFGGNQPVLLLLAGVSALVTMGAAGIATGLAAAEGRVDLSTLAAVGAGPGVRRLLSLCQAGVIAVLGSALGIVAGLGSAGIILTFTNERYADAWPRETPYPMVVPWLTLGVLVAVPLVAMLGAALLTRSRLPVERRLD